LKSCLVSFFVKIFTFFCADSILRATQSIPSILFRAIAVAFLSQGNYCPHETTVHDRIPVHACVGGRPLDFTVRLIQKNKGIIMSLLALMKPAPHIKRLPAEQIDA
jgi:hypothetical protein